jgi:hypothetical protein
VIRRVLWLGAGIAVGVIVMRKASQAMKAIAPSSIAGQARESAVGFVETVRDFVSDVRDGMAEREALIHEAFERGVTLDELMGDEYDHEYESENGAGVRQ